MNIDNMIINAIETRTVLKINYKGEGERTIHPHVLYISTAGHKNIDSYQVQGYSERGTLPTWRPFTVSKITDIQNLNEKFDIAPGYNPNGEKYVTAIAKV